VCRQKFEELVGGGQNRVQGEKGTPVQKGSVTAKQKLREKKTKKPRRVQEDRGDEGHLNRLKRSGDIRGRDGGGSVKGGLK